jgi:hypothetical protein
MKMSRFLGPKKQYIYRKFPGRILPERIGSPHSGGWPFLLRAGAFSRNVPGFSRIYTGMGPDTLTEPLTLHFVPLRRYIFEM